jgi:hypothetical protein
MPLVRVFVCGLRPTGESGGPTARVAISYEKEADPEHARPTIRVFDNMNVKGLMVQVTTRPDPTPNRAIARVGDGLHISEEAERRGGGGLHSLEERSQQEPHRPLVCQLRDEGGHNVVPMDDKAGWRLGLAWRAVGDPPLSPRQALPKAS